MYYPLKEQDKIYRIDCDFYRQKVWALTWQDVVSFVKKNVAFNYEIKVVYASEIIPGAAILVGAKDGKPEGEYDVVEFGGWIINKSKEDEVSKLKSSVLEIVKEKVKGREWGDKLCKNYEKEVIRFLKNRYFTEEEKIDILECRKRYLEDIELKLSTLLKEGFSWEDTKEGYNYWKDIHYALKEEESTIKVGDKVRVKKSIRKKKYADGYYVAKDMVKLAGKEVRIVKVVEDNYTKEKGYNERGDSNLYQIAEDKKMYCWRGFLFERS